MSQLSRVSAVVLGVCLIFLVACGGGKKAPEATDASTPTTSDGAGTETPAVTATPMSASDELKAVSEKFNNVKSFRAKVHQEIQGQPTQDGTVEVTFPDRAHLVAGGNDFIQIGSDLYIKTNETWRRVSNAAPLVKVSDFNDSIAKFAEDPDKLTRGDKDVVDGKGCQRFLQEGGSEMCVADGLPLEMITKAEGLKITVVYMDFNAVDVTAPI